MSIENIDGWQMPGYTIKLKWAGQISSCELKIILYCTKMEQSDQGLHVSFSDIFCMSQS